MTSGSAIGIEKARLRLMHPIESPRLLPILPQRSLLQPMLPLAPTVSQESQPVLDLATRRMAKAIVTAIIEVIAGKRKPHQLNELVCPSALRAVSSLRRIPECRDLRIRSMRLQTPMAGVVEAAVHLQLGVYSRAAAFRLVDTPNGWNCTHLEAALLPRTITKAG
ncbi:MAG: Rv3235 family protein [Propionibacteriaceae bacterium]|nr:Rv3235 family protein [Propionibacteriaceae bacterium]